MKKNLIRLAVVTLTIVFVLSFAATAFAYAAWPNATWSEKTFGLIQKCSKKVGQNILIQWNCYAAQSKNSSGQVMKREHVDGVIGTRSVEYIKSYQLKRGIKADGKVGNATWKKMQSYITSTSDPKTGKVIYSTRDAIMVPKTSQHTKTGHWFTWNRNNILVDII